MAIGRAIKQPDFNSIEGNYVIFLSGLDGTNSNASAFVGLFGLSEGNVLATIFHGEAGNLATQRITAGSYSVDSNSGRVIFNGVGNNPPLAYLTTITNSIAAFVMGTDGSAGFGLAEFQPNAAYSAMSVARSYILGTIDPASISEDNDVALDTITPSESFSGVENGSTSGGLLFTVNFTSPFSIVVNANGTGTAGAFASVTDGTRIFLLDPFGEIFVLN